MVTSDEDDGDVQPLWLSDEPATADLWTRTYAEHGCSGLWPLLLDSLDPNDGGFRPWADLGAATSGSVRQLVEIHAQDRWRAITGGRLIALVRSGARGENGALAEREEAMAA
ncbi:hypothetical protein [Streptomyces sp. NPDC048266]|uniref:hypothetical protein n=1 Tax=Streptomyces sp. NPDC048266 TaxID=3155787 RepID=UPI0033CFC790